jgi:hypothetical protein
MFLVPLSFLLSSSKILFLFELKMTAGKPFIELLEVDSTNNYAMAQVGSDLFC